MVHWQEKNNTLGVVEFTPQAFLQSVMNIWFEQFQPRIANKSPITKLIDGASVQTTLQNASFNGESNLDLQYAMGLISPQQVTLFQVGDLVQGGSFNNFLDALDESYCNSGGGDSKDNDGIYPDTEAGGFDGQDCGTQASTKVISISYGSDEAALTPAYVQRQCMEYMKLGLQGITILFSSGDFGVAGNGGQCLNANGTLGNGKSSKFNPSFPGTCSFVTSVGATQIQNGSSVKAPEGAYQRVIFSGGAFSNVFSTPSYNPPPYQSTSPITPRPTLPTDSTTRNK